MTNRFHFEATKSHTPRTLHNWNSPWNNIMNLSKKVSLSKCMIYEHFTKSFEFITLTKSNEISTYFFVCFLYERKIYQMIYLINSTLVFFHRNFLFFSLSELTLIANQDNKITLHTMYMIEFNVKQLILKFSF